jgi:hypothetical protein
MGMLNDLQEDGLLGGDAIVSNTDQAIKSAMKYMDPEICRVCTSRVFLECGRQPGGEDYPGDQMA